MIKQSQTSWLDNEFGLDVSYQKDHCGCQQNFEYHLKDRLIINSVNSLGIFKQKLPL